MSDSSKSELNHWLVGGTLISGIVVIGALIALASGRLGQLSYFPEVQAGIWIVLAVTVLTFLLFVLTLGFRSLGLSNAEQPLALPSGSVRAFIALMLIMIFVILSVYAVRAVGEGSSFTYIGIFNAEDISRYAGENFLIREASGDDGMFNVWVVRPLSDEGKTLAQQLTTTVATLVVAVSGFYFGTSAVEQAAKAVSDVTSTRGSDIPLLRNIDPESGETSATVPVTLKGRNLSGTKSVKLIKDQETIEAENVLSNDTTIQCSFKLDKPASTGWSVVVENARGEKDELEEVFTITAA